MNRAILAGIAAAVLSISVRAQAPPKALETRLRELGARVLRAADELDVVRFTDNNGIIVEVRVAQ